MAPNDAHLPPWITHVLNNPGEASAMSCFGPGYRETIPRDFWNQRCCRCGRLWDSSHPYPTDCHYPCFHCGSRHFRQSEDDNTFFCCRTKDWFPRHDRRVEGGVQPRGSTMHFHPYSRPHASSRRQARHPPISPPVQNTQVLPLSTPLQQPMPASIPPASTAPNTVPSQMHAFYPDRQHSAPDTRYASQPQGLTDRYLNAAHSISSGSQADIPHSRNTNLAVSSSLLSTSPADVSDEANYEKKLSRAELESQLKQIKRQWEDDRRWWEEERRQWDEERKQWVETQRELEGTKRELKEAKWRADQLTRLAIGRDEAERARTEEDVKF